jgi:hypothetical protein
MTQDEIIEIAQECGLIGMRPHLDGIYAESLVAFAKLVAAKEREACAKVCEEQSDRWAVPVTSDDYGIMWDECVAAIRVRDQRTPERGQA